MKTKKRIPECNIILYASPGKERVYIKNDFRKMKTGMLFLQMLKKCQKKALLSSVADRSIMLSCVTSKILNGTTTSKRYLRSPGSGRQRL